LRKLNINPAEVSVEELFLIVPMLLKDTTSWLQAAVNEWAYPVSRDWLVQVAQYDMNAQLNTRKGRKPQLYKKPWPEPNQNKFGKARPDAREILRRSKDGDLEWQNKPTPM